VSRNFSRDQIENLPNTTLFISCLQFKKKEKERVCNRPREENVKRRFLSFFMEIAWKKSVRYIVNRKQTN
jgi:hypothetical protein